MLPDVAFKLRERHPLVALVHLPLALEVGLSAQQTALLRESERAALQSAARVIVTSDTTARHLVAHYGVISELIVVAPPGVDRAPMARGSSNSVVQLLSIGAVVPGKGFDLLVRALATLSELPWRLWIVGDRTRDMRTVAALDDAIARFGLAERIKMFGSVGRRRLEEFFDRADLLCLLPGMKATVWLILRPSLMDYPLSEQRPVQFQKQYQRELDSSFRPTIRMRSPPRYAVSLKDLRRG